MKIFISMKVPRANMELRQTADMLVKAISLAGHDPFLATDEIAQNGMLDFMPFVRQHIQISDLMIVIHHPELRGGLIEAGIAYAYEIPIWLCRRAGGRVSSSMLGCANVVIAYSDLNDLQNQLSFNLSQFPTL